MIPLAAQLMEAAEAAGQLPDTSRCMVLREDICLVRKSVHFVIATVLYYSIGVQYKLNFNNVKQDHEHL